MLKTVGLALCLVLGVVACNGILGNTAASGTDDHLFDQSGTDAATSDAGDAGDAGDATNGSDVGSESDAGNDAPHADAANIPCGTPAFVNTCLECVGKTMLCRRAGACVADCHADCGGVTGSPIECIGCDDAGVTDIAVCEAPGTPAACLAGHRRCRCPTGASECPGNSQVCTTNDCYACGESGTDTVMCKSGNQCDTGGGAAKYTCH